MLARPFFVANWKMNMLTRDAAKYVLEFRRLYQPAASGLDDTVLAPPFTLLATVREQVGGLPGVLLASQNLHWEDFGAHTGEISAPMLREFGVSFAIVGHSERRQFYGETSEAVAKRAAAALRHGIRPVICVGETLAEFEAGKTKEILAAQLSTSLSLVTEEQSKIPIIAYEPVWAIGTGKAATPKIISDVHEFIRTKLVERFKADGEKLRILYGGSTSPDNIEEIIKVPSVGGALIGGASLKAETFWSLISKARAAAA